MPLYNPSSLNPDFGGDFFSAESAGDSSTTSTTFQTKVTLNATATKTGSFVLQWYIRASTSQANRDFELRIIDEGNNTLGTFISRYPQASSEMPFSGFLFVNLTAGDSKNFQLQFRRISSTTLTVSNARLSFYKVS